MTIDEKTYHKLFVDSKIISEKDFSLAKEEAKKSDKSIEETLVTLDICTNEVIGKVMSKFYGVPFINLFDIHIDHDVAKNIPDAMLHKQMAIAYEFRDGKLQIAMVDPQNIQLISFIEKMSGMQVSAGYVTPDIFEDVLRSSSQDIVAQITKLSDDFEKKYRENSSDKGSIAQGNYSIQIVDLIMQYGYANNASDIHIEPRQNIGLVRYRIDGVLHDVVKISKELLDFIVSRIKIMSNLRTDEHMTSQDGKFKMKFGDKAIDIRVSIMPVIEGEKLVTRLLSEKGHAFTLNTLGLQEKDLKKIMHGATKPYGMILSTGPTGSGKTTMMYTIMKLLNVREVNIQTIEDPIEYELEGINQIQVNPLRNLSFANGLRSIVRQDPDIIMVGEIRDSETAGISVGAAMTGHIVLSTLHTNNAATAIPRLLDFGVEPFLIASSVNVIVAQRLIRQICRHCSALVATDLTKFKESIPENLYKKYFGKSETMKLSYGKGCSMCNKTGFDGRVGIFEVLEITEGIRELIMQKANADEIDNKAIGEGMTVMLEDGITKVINGVTTMEEVLRNTTIL